MDGGDRCKNNGRRTRSKRSGKVKEKNGSRRRRRKGQDEVERHGGKDGEKDEKEKKS